MNLISAITNQPLTYYLDLEAQLSQKVTEPTLFTWIAPPTVIYGRHQAQEVEVNEAYCREHGIAVVQRQSGGGCVYADRGNLMLSYMEPTDKSQEVFARFLHLTSQALRQMGYDAVTTAHNDILVGEHKVSGTACYTLHQATIVHATMLYDVDMDALEKAITPTAEKLAKHAVASVRQRVINLRQIKDVGDIIDFQKQLEHQLSNF